MRVFFTVFLVLAFSGLCFSSEDEHLQLNESFEREYQAPWTDGRFPYEGKSTEISFKKKIDYFSFSGNLKVKANNSYPEFQNDNSFIQEINHRVRQNAKDELCKFLFNFVVEEKEGQQLDQDALDLEFDKREFRYLLNPTYASPQLVSIFVELNYYAGLPHGSSHYCELNYWMDGQQIHELTLESLFSLEKDFASFLIDYCLSTLKNDQVGYFYPDPDGNVPVKIELKDLNVFTLSKNGLTITFQPYHVGGWADGPYSVTIPFDELIHLIRPNGPLSEFFSP